MFRKKFIKFLNGGVSENRRARGQVMLLTVLVLSAVFLSATVVAGLLMVYQLGQVARISDSAQAIYAADAAIERALFKIYRCNNPNTGDQVIPVSWQQLGKDIKFYCNSTAAQAPLNVLPIFLNNATYQLSIFSMTSPVNHDPGATPSNVKLIQATGRSGKSARAFEVQF